MIKIKANDTQNTLSSIEHIFASLTQLVLDEFSSTFELFEHKTFRQFSEMYILPSNVEDTSKFWEVFEDSAQFKFIEELDEVLQEFETFKTEFVEKFKTMKFLDEDTFCNEVTQMINKHLVETPYELMRIREALN
jgi:uncharacterized protein YbcC (UPF0753/DUF2309 family)